MVAPLITSNLSFLISSMSTLLLATVSWCVDRATRYNWVFGLKDLSKDSILSAFRLFQADAGSYARCFHCDCDPKLFGMTIKGTFN